MQSLEIIAFSTWPLYLKDFLSLLKVLITNFGTFIMVNQTIYWKLKVIFHNRITLRFSLDS